MTISDSSNYDEPSPLAIATASLIAAAAVGVTIALMFPLWCVAFVAGLPEAICRRP